MQSRIEIETPYFCVKTDNPCSYYFLLSPLHRNSLQQNIQCLTRHWCLLGLCSSSDHVGVPCAANIEGSQITQFISTKTSTCICILHGWFRLFWISLIYRTIFKIGQVFSARLSFLISSRFAENTTWHGISSPP